MSALVRDDPWLALRELTDARIALGRAGSGLPTRELLKFGLAHAQARDAVYTMLDSASLTTQLKDAGLETISVYSEAQDRVTFLQRPDLGRRLDASSASRLDVLRGRANIAIVIGDGLSALAAHRFAVPLIHAMLPQLEDWTCGPIVLAHQCRVALGDEIGSLLGADLVLVLLGERPGLSSPDSLGGYLTFSPQPGRLDAERNCVSNIRTAGLAPPLAAARLAWLMREALARRMTGIHLKDESDVIYLPAGE